MLFLKPIFCATFGAVEENSANAINGIVVSIPNWPTGTPSDLEILLKIGGIAVKGNLKIIPTTIIPGIKNLL
jgi:aspartate/methionine/tyrosine aminotransferase